MSPFTLSPALEDCTGAIRLCCSYARDAAEHGQFAAAHGLFQSAVVFFGYAQQLLARENEFSHEPRFDETGHNPLTTARAELDDCALYVYPDGRDISKLQEART